MKAQLVVVEGTQSTVQWEYETLLQRLEDLKQEKTALDVQLKAAVFEVKQKSAFKGLLLEKKLAALSRVQEGKNTHFCSEHFSSCLLLCLLVLIFKTVQCILFDDGDCRK